MNPQNQNAPDEHKKIGPIVAILIIIFVLIIAGLYFFASHINRQTVDTTNGMQIQTPDVTANSTSEVQPVTNKSDDLQSLNNDLNKSTQGLDNQNF